MRRTAAAAAVALAVLAPAAAAEGLVISSAVPDYPRGRIVADGEQVVLASGQWVEMLDRSGRRVRMERTGAYGADREAAARPGVLAAAGSAAVAPANRSDIGGVRAPSFDACLLQARRQGLGLAAEAECRKQFDLPERPGAIQVEVRPVGDLHPSRPLYIRIRTDFAAGVACTFVGEDGRSIAPIRLDGGDDIWVRVSPGRRLEAPSRSVAAPVLPSAPGARSIACAAVDQEVLRKIAPMLPEDLDPAEEMRLLSGYAAMAGRTRAEIALALTAPAQ